MKEALFSTKSVNEITENLLTDEKTVKCISAEQFANDYLESIAKGEELFLKMIKTDAVVISSFQFLSGIMNIQKGLIDFIESFPERLNGIILQSDRHLGELEICDELKERIYISEREVFEIIIEETAKEYGFSEDELILKLRPQNRKTELTEARRVALYISQEIITHISLLTIKYMLFAYPYWYYHWDTISDEINIAGEQAKKETHFKSKAETIMDRVKFKCGFKEVV